MDIMKAFSIISQLSQFAIHLRHWINIHVLYIRGVYLQGRVNLLFVVVIVFWLIYLLEFDLLAIVEA